MATDERIHPRLPAGTVTLLFTDIEGSTALLQRLGDRYRQVLQDHHDLVRAAIRLGDGHEVQTAGDAFFVVFERARGAVASAVAAQRAVLSHPWPDGVSVRVRMGLHTGDGHVRTQHRHNAERPPLYGSTMVRILLMQSAGASAAPIHSPGEGAPRSSANQHGGADRR